MGWGDTSQPPNPGSDPPLPPAPPAPAALWGLSGQQLVIWVQAIVLVPVGSMLYTQGGPPQYLTPTSPRPHPATLSPCLPFLRNSSAKELTCFAAEAIAVNRQLTRRDEDEEEEAEGEAQPIIIKATSRAMQLSPPSESKLAKRRQKSSLAKAVAAGQHLVAPLVLVADQA